MGKLNFLKNYFYILIVSCIIVVISKFIFLLYLNENFISIDISSSIYAIFWGYKFDLALASIVTFIITLFDFHKKSIVMVSSTLISIVFLSQISDIMYFNESSRHMGYEVSDAVTDAYGLIMTALSQHSFLSISSLLLSLLLFIFIYKISNTILSKITLTKFYILQKLLLLIFTIFFARGMFQGIPLNPWQSNQIGDAKLAALALNGSYNALYSILNKSKKLKPLNLPKLKEGIIKKELNQIYNSKYMPYKTNLNKPNIVFFFLESWSAVNIKSYGFNKVTTPFYEEILEKSIRPKGMMAGGHRTTEGMFSTLVSYPNPLGKTIAKTQLQNFEYTSIVDILNQDGYKSAFFQGSSKETSGTGSFAQKLGFENSYGKRDIKERKYEENYWGVHDTDLYNFTLKNLSNTKQPFVIGINGATTHDDKIPPGIKKINFVKDDKINNQLNALHFSDTALKEFVTKIQSLYPNTLFVFVADHCGGVKGSSFENYLIPFAIYHKDLKPKYYDIYLSQRDIAPAVLDLVFGDYKSITNNFTGKSLLSDNEFYADYYHNGILGWIEDNISLEINIATNRYKCYDVSDFDTNEINCTNDIMKFKNRALSFTNISQNLLFNGSVNEFKKFKEIK